MSYRPCHQKDMAFQTAPLNPRMPYPNGEELRMCHPVPKITELGPPSPAYQNLNLDAPGSQTNFPGPPLNLRNPPPSGHSSFPNHMGFQSFSTPPPIPNQFHTRPNRPPPHPRSDFTMGAGVNPGMAYAWPPPYRVMPPGNFQNFPPNGPFQQNSGIAQLQQNHPSQMRAVPFRPPMVNFSEIRPGTEKFDNSKGKKGQSVHSEDKQSGSVLLEGWLQKNRKQKRWAKKTERKVSSEAHVWKHIEQLSAVAQLLTDMSSQIKEMETLTTTKDNSTFLSAKSNLEGMKKKYLDLEPVLGESSVMEMEKNFSKLRKKRARLKRSRKEHWEKHQSLKEIWAEKDKEIDRWQERHRTLIKEENKKKARKAEADRTLAKVTREIQDATRLIETMMSLQKLRLIRRDAAQKRGETDLGESRQAFEQKIADMTRLVQGQLECYKEEEAQLKQVIKSQQEETRKKEKLVQLEREERKKKEEDEDLEVILFGPQEIVTETSPLFPYAQFYKQAEHSLEAFIQIRNEWDTFVVPDKTAASSTIPISWVVPIEPSSSAWASALT